MAALVALLIILPVMAGDGQDVDIDRDQNELRVGVYTDADNVVAEAVGVARLTLTGGDPSSPTEFDGTVYVSNQHNAGASNWVVVGVHEEDTDLVVLPSEDADDAQNYEVTVENQSGDERDYALTGDDPFEISFAVVHPDTPRPAYYQNGEPRALRWRTTGIDTPDDPQYVYLPYSTATTTEDSLRRPANARDENGNVYAPVNAPITETLDDLPKGVSIEDFRPEDHIEASDGDVLVISHANNEVEVVVDGVGPTFSGLTPDEQIQRRTRVSLEFTVADEGSGLRDDSETFGALGNNPDGDTKEEPLTSAAYGALADIGVFWGVQSEANDSQDAASEDDDDVDNDGDGDGSNDEDLTSDGNHDIDLEVDWIEITEGAAYDASALFGESDGAGDYKWVLRAKDRVGNVTTTDADADEPGIQGFTLTIDNESPVIDVIRTGINYSASKDREVADRNAIAVSFKNEESGNADRLDSIEENGFTVSGHTVVDVIHPNKAKKGDRPETRNVVYIILEDELGGNELPRVQLTSSAIVDLAGNSNQGADSSAAKDRISPELTVTVIGDGANADGRPLTTGEFEVTIDSDEPLNGVPIVSLATIARTHNTFDDDQSNEPGPAANVEKDPREARNPNHLAWRIETVRQVRVSTEGSTSWSVTFDDGDVTGVDGLGLVAVIVTGVDRAAGSPKNAGKTDGWEGTGEPDEGDELTVKDIDDAGLLVEFDDGLAEALITVTPDAGKVPADRQTESMSPFIKLDFAAEGAEYTVVSWVYATEDNGDLKEVDYKYTPPCRHRNPGCGR